MVMSTLQRDSRDAAPTNPGLSPGASSNNNEEKPSSTRFRRALGGLVRGPAGDPAWARPALLLLLAVTAGLYLWDLGASGWANSFYSAAVQAGTKSWKAFFFGSSDSSNFITVDKPPAALWVMEISARIFGLSSWSILVPQALEGVAAVAVLYATVRRWASPGAGLVAATIMAFTPVAALMFRFNNPDALLVLLLCGAAFATTVAMEKSSTRWLIFAFSLVGLGFITKMLQAFLVVPAISAAYLLAAPAPLWRRVRQLAAGGLALVVSAGWWVAAVTLTPAADRPYIGGSQDNNLLNLIFGYNGFGRITGEESGSVVGGGARGTSGQWAPTGLSRLFGSEMGSQISWVLPAALVLLVPGPGPDLEAATHGPARASMVLWGGWLIVTGVVFSLAQGIIHPYYTVALAPAIGAIVGIGGGFMWSRRSALWAGWLWAPSWWGVRCGPPSSSIASRLGTPGFVPPSWWPVGPGRAHRPFLLSGTAFPGAGGPDRCARTGGPGPPRRSLLIHSGHRRHSAFRGDPVGRPVIGRPGRVPRTGCPWLRADPPRRRGRRFTCGRRRVRRLRPGRLRQWWSVVAGRGNR